MKPNSHNVRRFRPGIRSCLASALVLSIAYTWLASLYCEGRRHEEIAAVLKAARCDVRFSHFEFVEVESQRRRNSSSVKVELRSTLPEFVESLGLSRIVRRVEHVRISDSSDLPTALDSLAKLGQVGGVSLYDTNVSQEELASTLSHVCVESFYAESESLPRSSITWLNQQGLKWLCLKRTQLSNPAINDLPESLEYFDACRTRINDEGLNAFVRLKNLKQLNLRRTPTTRAAIDRLRIQMPWCEIKWEPLTQT
jgi:hypothetical protein